jgi:hypothetical protein
MKNNTIVTLLALASSLSLSLCAVPLILHNAYQKPIQFKTNLTVAAYKAGATNKDYRTLDWRGEINLGDLNDITSLEIKGTGLYSSLNEYLQQLKDAQNDRQNIAAVISILEKQSSTSRSWNIFPTFVDLPKKEYAITHEIQHLVSNDHDMTVKVRNNTQEVIKLEATLKTGGQIRMPSINPNSFVDIYSPNQTYNYQTIKAILPTTTLDLYSIYQDFQRDFRSEGALKKCIYTITISDK